MMILRNPFPIKCRVLNVLGLLLASLVLLSPAVVSAQDTPPKAHDHGGPDDHDHDHEDGHNHGHGKDSGPKSLGNLIEDETLNPRFAAGPKEVWKNGAPVLAASLILLALRSKKGKT